MENWTMDNWTNKYLEIRFSFRALGILATRGKESPRRSKQLFLNFDKGLNSTQTSYCLCVYAGYIVPYPVSSRLVGGCVFHLKTKSSRFALQYRLLSDVRSITCTSFLFEITLIFWYSGVLSIVSILLWNLKGWIQKAPNFIKKH